MDLEDAHEELPTFEILIIPGGNSGPVMEKNEEPMKLIKAFAKLQQDDPSKERTLFTVCTGALFAASAGVLQGLAATTHPDYYTKLEMVCQNVAQKDTGERTDVMEERYVVNNARFDLGEDLDENPFITRKRAEGRRKSIARKGSNARRASVTAVDFRARRANMKLGGLRVVTAGGISCGIDAALYVVSATVSHESAVEVARMIQHDWKKGVTVDAIDV